ncbi:MAG: hypothetical protein ACI4OG_01850, partial [Bacilli bacterium]
MILAINQKFLVIKNKDEIMKSVNTKGVWRGILKSLDGVGAIDCTIQVIDTVSEKKEFAVTYMDISEIINEDIYEGGNVPI